MKVQLAHTLILRRVRHLQTCLVGLRLSDEAVAMAAFGPV